MFDKPITRMDLEKPTVNRKDRLVPGIMRTHCLIVVETWFETRVASFSLEKST